MATDVTLPLVAGYSADRVCGDGESHGCGTGGAHPRVETLIDRFLAEQGSMTAVERFARHHDEGPPAHSRYYRDLIPATPPAPGQQYAFEVDLDACSGCKACVTACHSLNGLEEGELWRSVGLVVGTDDQPSLQHVTSACHHCVEPACMSGCPVDAYEKDPDTGIVRHLDDQCIGCGYCIWTCPYEVPRYDRGRGIVRKCDMCADRLAAGEAPACVQACPTQAISLRVVDVEDVRGASSSPWPIASPSPSRTVPTTTYRTERDLSGLEAADVHALRPQHPHPPLAVMLVLIQVAVGTSLVDLASRWWGPGEVEARAALPSALMGFGVAVVALGASLLHLGRPRFAYRAVIGLRHSWLSREILAFGTFAALAALDAASRMAGFEGRLAELWLPGLVAAAGMAGVACSVMVYAVTGKRWWRLRTTGLRFSLTTVAGGLVVGLAVMSATAWAVGAAPYANVVRPLAFALVVVVVAKLSLECSLIVRHRRGPVTSELARTARLLLGELGMATRWRYALALLGGVLLPLLVLTVTQPTRDPADAAVLTTLAVVMLIAGELIERWQFFTAVTSRRMPGGIS
ncbi:MAG: dimethyl sulfoxide reductase anchor subunit [Actinomycetota bacterium]|nr:dimethyl sulfoxide reductase anchor subunit [Actinomycetota bacterium]